MSDKNIDTRVTLMVWLLAGNLVVTLVAAAALVFGLLPKVERAVSAVERVEGRFTQFADEVQPVLGAGADKAIETIKQVDAEQLSDTATEKADQLIDAAAERARRFLDRDKSE